MGTEAVEDLLLWEEFLEHANKGVLMNLLVSRESNKICYIAPTCHDEFVAFAEPHFKENVRKVRRMAVEVMKSIRTYFNPVSKSDYYQAVTARQ